MGWANRTLTDRALVMADMTMAAKFRMISPTIKVANHPQYESVTSRKRNRDYYRTFTCATPSKVHQVLSQYGVTTFYSMLMLVEHGLASLMPSTSLPTSVELFR